jgi:hypothetical protein
MRNLNRTIFILFLMAGIISILVTVSDLNEAASQSFDDSQSRLEIRWGAASSYLIGVLIILSALLAIGWRKIYPFNVPLALILAGFYYEWFFLTFTTGWVGLLGFIGLAFSSATGLILIVAYAIYFLRGGTSDKTKTY